MNNPIPSYFATCPKGLESLLKQELEDLGSSNLKETVAGVYFSGDQGILYRACMWSRLANKILMPLFNDGDKPTVDSADDLYTAAKTIPWEEHFPENGTLLVEFTGTNDAIRNTQFGAQTVKDAVVDRIRDKTGSRPDVSKTSPDIRINARLAKSVIYISLEINGAGLHKRGYRVGQGGAPLKENLAAAILLRAGWPEIYKAGGALLDPMCGSGTFLLEAGMMACKMAPGLLRARFSRPDRQDIFLAEGDVFDPQVVGFGFEKWQKHDPALWQQIVDEAEAIHKQALESAQPEIRGYDIDHRVLGTTRRNITVTGLDDIIRVTKKDVSEFKKPTHKEMQPGLIICNPPYGERLGEVEALRQTYFTLAQRCKEEFSGWQLGVFTGNKELGRELRLRPKKKYQLYNGLIPSELLMYDVRDEGTVKRATDVEVVDGEDGSKSWFNARELPLKERPLSSGAAMVANRLKKRRKQLVKWTNKNRINSFRLYDADMPEYAAAIDHYLLSNGDIHCHIQEYAPPKTIDEAKAQERFDDLVHACAVVLDLSESQISTRVRRRNKGKTQYEKELANTPNVPLYTLEEGAELEVNFDDYLDTGLFLDHRPLRRRIRQEARGKTFLNLFCYTATATVQAALGGATSSVSVDMSNTYLDWAQRNLERNDINRDEHTLIRNNCEDWLKVCRQGFDLIMLDPPSFSNSKRMEGVLDIQRDHVGLITRCMEILNPGGTLYFSNNLRSFKLDEEALQQYNVRQISKETLDPDFIANPRIHYCWAIQC
jgi:23S rRNA m(2)G-2445 methyltransferase (EC 2.1.1.52)